jgi:hypothetical protein
MKARVTILTTAAAAVLAGAGVQAASATIPGDSRSGVLRGPGQPVGGTVRNPAPMRRQGLHILIYAYTAATAPAAMTGVGA